MPPTLKALGIDRLSAEDRLELIGEIWDSLVDDDPEGSIPERHRPELERRLEAAEADPGAAIPWEVVKARLAERP
jgi:putative addiction module component (TIGR02574 family)